MRKFIRSLLRTRHVLVLAGVMFFVAATATVTFEAKTGQQATQASAVAVQHEQGAITTIEAIPPAVTDVPKDIAAIHKKAVAALTAEQPAQAINTRQTTKSPELTAGTPTTFQREVTRQAGTAAEINTGKTAQNTAWVHTRQLAGTFGFEAKKKAAAQFEVTATQVQPMGTFAV
jgi:hypothetical protein